MTEENPNPEAPPAVPPVVPPVEPPAEKAHVPAADELRIAGDNPVLKAYVAAGKRPKLTALSEGELNDLKKNLGA